MQPRELFEYCPKCGTAIDKPNNNPLLCPQCDFRYFFNPTVAAAAFVFNGRDEVLLLRRAREPAQGKFGLPGGFVDIGESAEVALHREAGEEVGLILSDVQYLCSCPNFYVYKEVTYPVCDLIFTARATSDDVSEDADEVAGTEWRTLADIQEDDLAFPSMKKAWRMLRAN